MENQITINGPAVIANHTRAGVFATGENPEELARVLGRMPATGELRKLHTVREITLAQ